MHDPDVQLIANLVVTDPAGRVLLTHYDDLGEEGGSVDRWWLPGHQLEPYQHPDEAARLALAELDGVTGAGLDLARVQSFRGRRGWHVSFDYLVRAEGDPADGRSAWFARDQLPRTTHGGWERQTIDGVLG